MERLQEDFDLPVTGLLDPASQAALAEVLGQQESAQVAALQGILTATGHYGGPIDGVWSPEVEEALKELQTDLGVPATGVVDAATLRLRGCPGRGRRGTTADDCAPGTPHLRRRRLPRRRLQPFPQPRRRDLPPPSRLQPCRSSRTTSSMSSPLPVSSASCWPPSMLRLTERLFGPGPFTLFAPPTRRSHNSPSLFQRSQRLCKLYSFTTWWKTTRAASS